MYSKTKFFLDFAKIRPKLPEANFSDLWCVAHSLPESCSLGRAPSSCPVSADVFDECH